MSFSVKVKEEIVRHGSSARHCRIAELLALALATGEVEINGGEIKLIFHPENSVIADKICALIDILSDGKIKYAKNAKSILINSSKMSEELLLMLKLSDYIKFISDDWLSEDELMENLVEDQIVYVSSRGISLQNLNFPKQVVQKECCKKSFIRGFFLASGSVNDPNKAYHFEIVAENREMADVLRDVINSFGLDAKIVKRKKYYVVYLKEGSMIVDILNIMEAYVSLMDMENVRILKDMRNDINRRVNCETANIKKTVSAAVRQIEDIEYIEKTKGFKYLPKQLRELAELRLAEPEANLSELGEMLNPPISKSGVNHRLRKISKIAFELRNDNHLLG